MGEFSSDDHYIYYCGQESPRRNGIGITVKKRVRNAVLGCDFRNDRMISVHFQGKPFSITVIQVYALTSNSEEAEVEQFYEDLQDLLELTPRKDVLFIIGDWNANVGSQETPGKSEVSQSCLTLCDPIDCSPPGSSVHGIFPGMNTGVGCHFLLQGIFPTQGLNPGLPHCRQTLYHLSYQGNT